MDVLPIGRFREPNEFQCLGKREGREVGEWEEKSNQRLGEMVSAGLGKMVAVQK